MTHHSLLKTIRFRIPPISISLTRGCVAKARDWNRSIFAINVYCRLRRSLHIVSEKRLSNRMPKLTEESVTAIHRLLNHASPETSYYTLMPLSRRAAVLLLLFPDVNGRLRVVLTLRSEYLRNFAGQVALPGGKADTLEETAEDTARREAYEEIGLPLPNHKFVLPVPVPRVGSSGTQGNDENQQKQQQQVKFSITHLTELPCSLSRNNLAVRPVVAVLLPEAEGSGSKSSVSREELTLENLSNLDYPFDLESLLIPRLDPKEVAAVFSAPLEAFLKEDYAMDYTNPPTPAVEKWYKGKLQHWYGRDWYMHEFMAPVWAHKAVTPEQGAARSGYNDKLLTPEEAIASGIGRKLGGEGEGKEDKRKEDKDNVLVHYRVWGMTARILVDAARIAYGREPEFDCLKERGDEEMIGALYKHGMMKEERKHGEEFVVQELFKGNL